MKTYIKSIGEFKSIRKYSILVLIILLSLPSLFYSLAFIYRGITTYTGGGIISQSLLDIMLQSYIKFPVTLLPDLLAPLIALFFALDQFTKYRKKDTAARTSNATVRLLSIVALCFVGLALFLVFFLLFVHAIIRD